MALANTIKPTYVSVNVKIDVETMNGGQITGVVIRNLRVADPKQEMESLITAPLAAMPTPARPILTTLDSLDEAFGYNPNENLVTLLAGLNNLPRWVRILLTSRPERRVLKYFETRPKHILAAESELNQDDLRRYVRYRIDKGVLSERLQKAKEPVESDAFLEHVTKLADGNFLYAKILLNDIETGALPLDDLTALPKGLDEIYHAFLARLTVEEWQDCYQPILGVLAVAQEPIPEDQIARFTGLRRTQVGQYLGVVLQFLDERQYDGEDKAYTLFHQSLRDYLLERDRNTDFWCAPEDGHDYIAGYYHEIAAAILDIVDRWPPEARTLEQATDQSERLWDVVIGVAGQDKFEE